MDPHHHFDDPAAERVEGNWKLFMGYLREKWGDLTDDEIQRTEGKREQLLGYLQEKRAEEREELERDLDDIAHKAQWTW